MRVSIVGGLERLSKEYVNACKGIGCKAKVYNKLSSNFEESLKCSQCVLLLIGLSSHKWLTLQSGFVRKTIYLSSAWIKRAQHPLPAR